MTESHALPPPASEMDAPVDAPVDTQVDVLVAGLGPGGCMAALTAHRLGLRVLGTEARGRLGNRGRLVVVRPKAQTLLSAVGLSDITRGRLGHMRRLPASGLLAWVANARRGALQAEAGAGPWGRPLR